MTDSIPAQTGFHRPAIGSLSRFFQFLVALAFLAQMGWGQTNYVSWDFNTSITNANYSTNQVNQNAARTSALTGATFTGMTLSTVTGATANTLHRTTAWPTATSLSTSHYIEYGVALASGQALPNSTLSLAMSVQTSSATAAPTRMQIRYGYGASPTFADAGTAQTIGTATTNPSITIPAPGNTSTTQLTIRIHCYNSTTATGNFRILTSSLTGASPTTVATPAITGSATASAFTTTYGTPSSTQTFSVSGNNLTADLIATAPTGFEVASDGATYGSTATFTQTGGSASGTLSVRLKATAAVSGSYNSQNIVLSSTGATSVNIVTASSGNAVSPRALSITASAQTKTYGSAIALGTSLFSSTGLENSETIGSVTLTSPGSSAAAAAGSYTITPSAATGGTFIAGNYSITYNTGTLTVDPKALTITANAVTKPFGETLASPVTGSTAFSSSGLVGSETIGSVTITYGTGAASGDTAGTYPDQVTPSLAVGGTFNITNYSPTYVSAALTVTADPTITVNGVLTSVNTTYGSASASPSSFTISGIFLTGDLTIIPPSGFEISTAIGSGYTTSLTIPASGTLGNTSVFVRLAATTAFGTFSGDIIVSGGGAPSKVIATASSSVSKKALTITGLAGANKVYDQTTAASVTGTPAYVGLENGETFAVSGTASASFSSASAGTAKAITVTGFDAPSSNYSVSQPTGLSADITPAPLSITAPTIADKVYNGTATAGTLTVGTLSGFVGTETVSATGAVANYPSPNVGTYTDNVVTYTLQNGTNGGLAANYSLSNGTATGAITAKTLTITAVSVTKTYGVTLTGGSGSTAFTSSGLVSPETIGSVTIAYGTGAGSSDAAGTYTGQVSASAATGGTFNAANYSITYVAGNITVELPLIAGWDFQTTTNGGAAVLASPNTQTSHTANFGSGTIYLDGNNGSSNWAAATELSAFSGTAVNAATGFSTTTTSPACLALLNGSSNSANGKKMVIKFSMTGRVGLVLSYATQKTNTGFDTHLWEYSTNGTTWTTAETIGSIASSFAVKTLATINGLNEAPTAYLRLTVSGSTGTNQNNRVDNIQIRAADAPVITFVGTTTAFVTTYGTASADQSFSISGTKLLGDITVTAPTGFEVSNGGVFGATTTFAQSGGGSSGTLKVRLKSTAAVSGSYNSQNIVISSTSATPVNITTTASGNSVAPAPLTITGISANDKTYDATTSATLSGTPAYSGLVNSESFSVTGTAIATFVDSAVGTGKPVSVVGFTAPSANYTVTQPEGLTASIISIYASWAADFPGFTDTASGSDPDSDLKSNLLEFAFGTDPTTTSSGYITYANGVISANGQPTTSIANVTNGVDYRAVFGRRKDYVNAGLTYTVQFSAGLDVWVTSEEVPVVVASDANMEAVSVPYPLFIVTARGVEKPTFFRVAVSSN